LTSGDEVKRAQSRGECPGVRSTFFRGLVGIEECVGGNVREEEVDVGARFGRGERLGGAMRPGAACWKLGTWFDRGGPRTPPKAR